MDDAFDFAFAPGVVGLVMEEADAEVGTDDVGVFANEGGTVVDVEFVREASTKDGFFEGMMEGFGVLPRVVGGVGKEARVLVDDDGEVSGKILPSGPMSLGPGLKSAIQRSLGNGASKAFLGPVPTWVELSRKVSPTFLRKR